jgi:hypothetical protein
MQLNHVTLEKTNAKLDPTGLKAPLTESELLTHFGIRLNMTLDRKRLDVAEYWEEETRPGSTFTPPDYGRFGMTRHRFQAISRALRFSDYDEGIVEEVSTLCAILIFFSFFFLLFTDIIFSSFLRTLGFTLHGLREDRVSDVS